MTKRVWAILVLAVALAGCAEAQRKHDDPDYVPSAGELTRIADEWPADDPLKPTAQAVALERFSTAQAHESAAESAEATRQAEQEAAERQYVILTTEAQMTREAHQRTIEVQNVWATQQAANATQVAEATDQALAVQATIEAQHAQATATERAYRATATTEARSYEATAMAEAHNYAATVTAQVVAMAETATRQAWEARTTATAEAWEATRQTEHIVLTRQAEKREATMGAVRDFGVPLLLLLLAGGVGVLLVYGIRYVVDQAAKRPIVYPRNFLGDAEPMAVPDRNGGYTFIDLDRQPGHVTRVLPSGEATAPQFRSAGQEERTTARDQAVDGVTRPRIGAGAWRAEPPALAASQPAAPPRAPAPGLRSVRVLRRLDQAGKAGFLPGPLLASIEADWEMEM